MTRLGGSAKASKAVGEDAETCILAFPWVIMGWQLIGVGEGDGWEIGRSTVRLTPLGLRTVRGDGDIDSASVEKSLLINNKWNLWRAEFQEKGLWSVHNSN